MLIPYELIHEPSKEKKNSTFVTSQSKQRFVVVVVAAFPAINRFHEILVFKSEKRNMSEIDRLL